MFHLILSNIRNGLVLYPDKRKYELKITHKTPTQPQSNHHLQTTDILDITTHCYNYLHIIRLARFTLKAFELPSTETETGPAVATAAWRPASLPDGIFTMPVCTAPIVFLLKWHGPCCVSVCEGGGGGGSMFDHHHINSTTCVLSSYHSNNKSHWKAAS